MGRGLVSVGALLLAATVAYWVGDAVGWVPPRPDEHWSLLLARAGLVCVAAGLLLRLLTPAGKKIANGRCQTCGRATLPGHPYCMDHLQASVNTWRDQTRAGMISRPKGRKA